MCTCATGATLLWSATKMKWYQTEADVQRVMAKEFSGMLSRQRTVRGCLALQLCSFPPPFSNQEGEEPVSKPAHWQLASPNGSLITNWDWAGSECGTRIGLTDSSVLTVLEQLVKLEPGCWVRIRFTDHLVLGSLILLVWGRSYSPQTYSATWKRFTTCWFPGLYPS